MGTIINSIIYNQIFVYIFKVILCSGILWLVLKTIGSNLKFGLQRVLLLATFVTSVALPLIKIDVWSVDPIVIENNPEVESGVVNMTNYEPTGWTASEIVMAVLGGIYFVIALMLIVRFVVMIIRVVRIKPSDRYGSFSFFNKIYVGKCYDGNREMVIAHEEAHVKLKHSIDVLFIELVTIVFWFNPFFYLLKKSLKEVHEFQADKAVADAGFNIEEYKYLIFSQLFGDVPEVAGGLTKILTKKRIIMINKNVKRGWAKGLLLIPVVASLMVLVSFTNRPAEVIYVGSEKQIESVPQDLAKETVVPNIELANDSLKKANVVRNAPNSKQKDEKIDVMSVNVDVLWVVDGKEMSSEEASKIKPEDIASMTVVKDVEKAKKIYGEKAKNGFVFVSLKKAKSEIEPVIIAEEMPTFMGKKGISAFSKWCMMNLKYPEEAVKNKLEGRVIVSFVVGIDGKVGNVKLVHGVNKLLDDAAIDVVQSAPQEWTVGKNNGEVIPVLIQIPIVFKI